MSLSSFFSKLGAPLKNQRWSWGGIRKEGSIVLRVWQDRKEKIDGKLFMIIANHERYKDNQSNPGYKERIEHINKIKTGAKCYMVMCLAKSPDAFPREIKSYNKEDIFVGGELLNKENKTYISLEDRHPISKIT